MDIDLGLLSYLVLGDDVQIGKALVQKGGDIVGLLQDFRVDIVVNELEQLLENPLNVADLV